MGSGGLAAGKVQGVMEGSSPVGGRHKCCGLQVERRPQYSNEMTRENLCELGNTEAGDEGWEVG